MKLYLIGSLRNADIPALAAILRQAGHEVFDDWFSAGPEADDYWRDYEKARGHSYLEALRGYAAGHVFDFDRKHLAECDGAVLALPAGKSGHLEMGWCLGQGKPGHILLDSPDRWDVMYKFATGVHDTIESLLGALK